MSATDYIAWEEFFNGTASEETIIRNYLFNKYNFASLSLFYSNSSNLGKKAAIRILNILNKTNLSEIINMIKYTDCETLSSKDFPWFYNLPDAMFTDLLILKNESVSNEELALRTPACNLKSKANMQRFGQAQASFLQMLGLLNHVATVNELSVVGVEFCKMNVHQRVDIFTKLFFRLPLIREVYRMDRVDINNIKFWAEGNITSITLTRRLSSIKLLIEEINTQLMNQ